MTENHQIVLTSHSIDNVFDYCPRKFEFLSLYDKRPDRESGFAADVGTALHEATQEYCIRKAEGESEDSATTHAYLQLLQWYPFDREAEQSTSYRSFDNTNLMLYKIIRWHGWDDWELAKIEGFGWGIEVPFRIVHKHVGEFEIKNTGRKAYLATQGKIDFILRNKATGEYATLDLKTTILQKHLIQAEYRHSGQQVGYQQVLQTLLGGAQKEFEIFYLVAHFQVSEEPLVHLVTIDKEEGDIDDYWLGKTERLMRMRYYAESGWFPRTNGGCHTWGTECTFFQICQKRDYKVIERWFDTELTEPNRGYDYAIDLIL